MAKLRTPTAEDRHDLAELMTQLGYPCNPSEIPGRLERLGRDTNVLVSVAEHESKVDGVATGQILDANQKSEPVAMLTALVVLERARGMGIGSLLVAHVEQWARARDARAISLTSALRRTEAGG